MRTPAPLLAVVVAVTVSSSAMARDGGEPRGGSWSFTATAERRHDDNILQMTPHDLQRFADNPTSSRFQVVSTDDDITALGGDLRWRGRPWRRRATVATASVDAAIYDRNAIKNSQTYAAQLTQEITARRRSLLRATAWARRTPSYYLLEVTDADASFEAQHRIRRSLVYGETAFGGRLTQELLRGRLSVSAGLERAHRDYGPNFRERDNDNDSWRLGATVRPHATSEWALSLDYLAGTLTARGDLPETPVRDTDISYLHHGLGVAVSAPWGRRGARGHLDAWLTPETRRYTTADKFDVTRFGRVTDRLEIGGRVTQHVWGPLDVQAAGRHRSTDSQFPAGTFVSSDDADFAQTRLGLAVRARLR